MFDLIIKEGLVLIPDPKDQDQVRVEELDLGIKDGKIAQIGSLRTKPSKEEFSAKNLFVLPGLIDTQVHFREPGLGHKEDIYHGSLSALKGGITGFFEMPNTLPPTALPKDLEEKIGIAEKNSFCDYAFYLGAVQKNKTILKDIEFHRACPGVKLFLGNSTGNLALEDDESLKAVFSNRKRITAIHSEDETRLRERESYRFKNPPHARNHPLWRDAKTCLISTERVLNLARQFKASVHILHVTTKEEIELLSKNKDICSVEVTPQHLTLFAPSCYEDLGSLVQMNPPIREKEHQEALWKGVRDGTVDMLGSDHAPHTLEEKRKTYPDSPSGMPGVQTLLPLMLNHVNEGKLDLKLLVRLLAHNPSRRFQLKDRGFIKEGFLANLTLVDLKKEKTITSSWLASKCGWSPFEGLKVKGWPVSVFLRGKKCMAEDEVLGKASGQAIEFSS